MGTLICEKYKAWKQGYEERFLQLKANKIEFFIVTRF